MNVQLQMIVTATPCAPTLKGLTSVDVFEGMKEMAELAPVSLVNSKSFV